MQKLLCIAISMHVRVVYIIFFSSSLSDTLREFDLTVTFIPSTIELWMDSGLRSINRGQLRTGDLKVFCVSSRKRFACVRACKSLLVKENRILGRLCWEQEIAGSIKNFSSLYEEYFFNIHYNILKNIYQYCTHIPHKEC